MNPGNRATGGRGSGGGEIRSHGPWAAAATLAAMALLTSGCTGNRALVELEAGSLGVRITTEGRIGAFTDLDTGREYLPEGMAPPLLTLRVPTGDLLPERARFAMADSTLDLFFPGELRAGLRVRTRPTHLSLELLGVNRSGSSEVVGSGMVGSGVQGSDLAKGVSSALPGSAAGEPSQQPLPGVGDVELAIWGPYPTTIRETIGETVGVVRGGGFAMGIQALNPRTLGGYPWNENDAMPQLDIFESGDYSDLSEEGKRQVLYRVEAAKPDSFGSTLQAYARNRREARVIANWGHDRYVAPPFEDGGVVGSAIALFGCEEEEALSVLGAIEVAEGLPHPLIDGVWGKEARSASAAYLILPFNQATLDRALDVTLEAGLRYLYHPDPFATWGHFPLGGDFPDGAAGLRRAAERAGERGVMLGVHTLSNFITTDDAYVTPVPDPRLARVGSAALVEEVPETATEITLDSPEFFNRDENDHLGAVVIGEELLQYGDISDAPPWTLLNVRRGAFETRATSHQPGDSVGKLADHAYGVFLGDAELSVEVARNVAALFNETGLRQISFDGLEGNRSTGMGNYGEILFTTAWYEALSPEIRRHFVADASRTSHYFWHIYTRMNWGEPWYAGFRESQTEYRLRNQAYFRRNLMPGMLGWFRMTPETSVEAIEWMLARSAAFDAGYAFVTSFDVLERNGRSDEILELLGRWEEARMADAFSPDQKTRMEDIRSEFRLQEAGDGTWTLTPIHVSRHRIEERERQPGESTREVFPVENPGAGQPLGFILTATGGSATGIRLEVDRGGGVDIPAALEEGEALVYDGGVTGEIYSPQWRLLETVPVDPDALMVGPGRHELGLDVMLDGGEEAHLGLELRLPGAPEMVAPVAAGGERQGEGGR